jgi:hypothetical protein
MAFNPFHSFRKYRKTLFAMITILCMFVFILSSGLGKGDFFSQTFGGSAPAVATIGGRLITGLELKRIRQNRIAASDCMTRLFTDASSQLDSRVETLAKKKEIGTIDLTPISTVLQLKRLSPQYLSYFYQSNGQAIEQIIGRLILDKKTDEADLLRQWNLAVVQLIRLYGHLAQKQLYFGGSVETDRDVLDFLVWKWVADQNNIHLSREVVEDLIHRETFGQDIVDASKDFLKQTNRYSMTADDLMAALTEEFRVRMAQKLILGVSTQAVPAYVTPREFYNYFRDVRTTVRVSLLPTDADAFVAQVTQQPTDSELRDLFNKGRRTEPSPATDAPAFKEGKKVKVQWIGLNGDNPLLRTAALADAEKKVAHAELVKKTLFAPCLPGFGSVINYLQGVSEVNDPKLLNNRLDSEYTRYVANQRFENASWLYSAVSLFNVHEQSVYKPQVIAMAVAGMLTAKGTGAGVPSLGVTIGSQAVVEELRERVRFGLLPFALAGQQATPLLGVSEMILPPPLPREALRYQLRENVTPEVVREYIREEFSHFTEELAKLGKDIAKPESKSAIAKLVNDFTTKYGLKHGASSEFHDRYTLISDPGLKPLKDSYLQYEAKNAASKPDSAFDLQGDAFASNLFEQRGLETKPEETMYQPNWLNGNDPAFGSFKDDEFFLYWKTEELPAKERSFEAARADVEKAWRLNKARELANKAAEAMQAELKQKAIRDRAALNDFALGHGRTIIEVGPIAKLNERLARQPGEVTQYSAPTVPREKIAYPSADMAEKLVDLRDKPIGESIIVTDAPKRHYYVAVLTERTEPSDFLFDLIYSRSGYQPTYAGGDSLMSHLIQEKAIKFFTDVMQQLRNDCKYSVNKDLMKESERRESD